MFNQPTQGSNFRVADHVGSLLLIYPREMREGISTSYGTADAIAADIHVLDGPDAPEVHENTLLFQKALIGSLRSAIGGEPVLARLGQGVAKPGQSAPYVLQQFSEQDAAVATAYVNNQPAAPAPAPQPQQQQAPAQTAAPEPQNQAPAQPAAPAAPAQPQQAGTVDIASLPPEVQELMRQMGTQTAG